MKMQVGKLLAAGAVLAVGPAVPQAVPDVEVRAVRFHRSGSTTLVDGFCRVPFTVIQPVSRGADGEGFYTVEVAVRDSSGLVLHRSAWSQAVPSSVLAAPGTSAVEHFSFGTNPGQYSVEVTVRDSASGRVTRSMTRVTGYDKRPLASDVLLTAIMRQAAGPADTTAAPGELRKGGWFLTSATRPVLTPREATLYYYVELYPGAVGEADLVARVIAADGREVISAPPQRHAVGKAGGVATSGLNLAGLPPGDYTLELAIQLTDSRLTRKAGFVMAGFETDAAIAELVSERTSDLWDVLTEQQLDSLYRPLVHIMENDERGIYEGLTVDGRRNFLRRFWSKRDPTPGTPDNEAQAAYYARIAEANRLFREGGAGETSGWRTDRGRIFLRNGAPEETFEQPQPTGPFKYEVWKYARGRGNKYVFIDESGFGNYVLVYTEDRFETSRPSWESYFDEEDLRRIRNF